MNRRVFLGLATALTVRPIRAATSLRVQMNGRVQNLDVEQYVSAVVAGESSVFRSEEALKAMAVAARTYAARFRNRHAAEGFDLCSTTHCQRVDVSQVSTRTSTAAQRTAGEILEYRGQPALTYYTRDCGGFIEDVHAVWPDESAPYLKGKPDPSCAIESSWHWETSGQKLVEVLRRAELRTPSRIERITVVERVPASGRVKMVALMGAGESVRVSASTLRFAVGRAFGFNSIASDQYKTGVAGDRLVFDGVGSGHGVGLCQHGADRMGSLGRSYRDVLAFYFPGTTIAIHKEKELVWRKVSGERMALFTTQPSQDGFVLAIAERQLKNAEQRVRLTAPRGLELRAFPNVAEFISATGEPGWVAARTAGREIQMQPPGTLRDKGALDSTLRHEILHAVIEAHSRPNLPVWFREGLVEYFADTRETGPGTTRDRELRQTADEARAREAYRSAARQVGALVTRYGETAVLGWLATGLPRDVMNAANKQAPTKSK